MAPIMELEVVEEWSSKTRETAKHPLLGHRPGGDTTGEVLRARPESPAEAAIRMNHKEVSVLQAGQGGGVCRGRNAEG